MRSDPPAADIEHGIAGLRAAYPHISACHATLEQRSEAGRMRHALRLEIRWPQHQSLVSGPPCDSREAAHRSLTRHA